VKPAGFTVNIKSPDEVLLKFKDELKLVMTPSRSAKRIYIYGVKALLCCQPYGKPSFSFHLVYKSELNF